MYYTENNHNKVVLRDFYLSTFENGPITEPCGTPEYLGMSCESSVFVCLCFDALTRLKLWPYVRGAVKKNLINLSALLLPTLFL